MKNQSKKSIERELTERQLKKKQLPELWNHPNRKQPAKIWPFLSTEEYEIEQKNKKDEEEKRKNDLEDLNRLK